MVGSFVATGTGIDGNLVGSFVATGTDIDGDEVRSFVDADGIGVGGF